MRAAANLGLANLAMATFWGPTINKTLEKFFARAGVRICGSASQAMQFEEFKNLTVLEQANLAYELGREAFMSNPDCDGLYLGGGSWHAHPVARDVRP